MQAQQQVSGKTIDMNEHIARQTQAFLAAAVNTEVPAEVQAAAQEGVAKARDAFATWNAAALTGTRAADEVMLAGRSGAKAFGDKVLNNVHAAAEAAFDAAQALARAKTIPEAVQLQTRFVQEQLAMASQQGKALFELSAKVAQETTDALAAIATKAASDPKKGGE
jgi:phasin family protein